LNMPLVIGPLDGYGLEMHVGHGLGLVHDFGLGVGQSYKPCWDHIRQGLILCCSSLNIV